MTWQLRNRVFEMGLAGTMLDGNKPFQVRHLTVKWPRIAVRRCVALCAAKSPKSKQLRLQKGVQVKRRQWGDNACPNV
jgi:hypothetical protein